MVLGGVTWTAGGLQSRTTAHLTESIANRGSADVSITTPSGYALLSIATSHAAWVTLYSDTAVEQVINLETLIRSCCWSGVLAEVITTGNSTQLITPGVICYNSGGAGQNTTYAKIVNRSGSTNNINVTLTYITIESLICRKKSTSSPSTEMKIWRVSIQRWKRMVSV